MTRVDIPGQRQSLANKPYLNSSSQTIYSANFIFITFSGRNNWTNCGVLGAKSLIAHERNIECWSARSLSIPLEGIMKTALAWCTLKNIEFIYIKLYFLFFQIEFTWLFLSRCLLMLNHEYRIHALSIKECVIDFLVEYLNRMKIIELYEQPFKMWYKSLISQF